MSDIQHFDIYTQFCSLEIIYRNQIIFKYIQMKVIHNRNANFGINFIQSNNN